MVTITGTGFSTTASTVNFGTVAATAVTCSSTTTCSATSPAGTAGTVDVTVIVGGQTSPTGTADQFTYGGSSTTTTTTTTTTTGNGSGSGGNGGGSSALAFTGLNPIPLTGLALALVTIGGLGARSIRRRNGKSVNST
jgi:hypothetical protein